MSQEHCSQNHRYLSNCVNLGSFLVTVMLITYLEQCSTTQLQNSTAAGRECWFNWTKIVDGQTHGLETPCVGLNCTNAATPQSQKERMVASVNVTVELIQSAASGCEHASCSREALGGNLKRSCCVLSTAVMYLIKFTSTGLKLPFNES
ncbi:uncharacterized protein LOC119180070 isoform X1 [Rhipicephalus microplus]|uniref:uncharacterized protein LOC119180070 isoform X1 n=1 Tax=Rhipicephalus microplus TaxID=6941 RepID=UPI003F6C8EF5